MSVTPPHRSEETEIALMASHLLALEEKVDKIIHERDQALIWGIRTLGTLLIGLAAWVYNLVVSGKHLS